MVCPWLVNGKCTSPRFPKNEDPTKLSGKCFDDWKYKTCPYYVEPRQTTSSKNLVAYTDERLKRIYKPYPLIHALPTPPSSECPHFKTIEYEGYYTGYCDILDRLLTKTEVELCIKRWRECPIRIYHEYTKAPFTYIG